MITKDDVILGIKECLEREDCETCTVDIKVCAIFRGHCDTGTSNLLKILEGKEVEDSDNSIETKK